MISMTDLLFDWIGFNQTRKYDAKLMYLGSKSLEDTLEVSHAVKLCLSKSIIWKMIMDAAKQVVPPLD